MKTMILAAAAALSLGIGSAYADSEGGQVANTQFTNIPGFVAQAPVQNAPAVATAQNGQAVRTYVTQSSHGTWLYAPTRPVMVRTDDLGRAQSGEAGTDAGLSRFRLNVAAPVHQP